MRLNGTQVGPNDMCPWILLRKLDGPDTSPCADVQHSLHIVAYRSQEKLPPGCHEEDGVLKISPLVNTPQNHAAV